MAVHFVTSEDNTAPKLTPTIGSMALVFKHVFHTISGWEFRELAPFVYAFRMPSGSRRWVVINDDHNASRFKVRLVDHINDAGVQINITPKPYTTQEFEPWGYGYKSVTGNINTGRFWMAAVGSTFIYFSNKSDVVANADSGFNHTIMCGDIEGSLSKVSLIRCRNLGSSDYENKADYTGFIRSYNNISHTTTGGGAFFDAPGAVLTTLDSANPCFGLAKKTWVSGGILPLSKINILDGVGFNIEGDLPGAYAPLKTIKHYSKFSADGRNFVTFPVRTNTRLGCIAVDITPTQDW